VVVDEDFDEGPILEEGTQAADAMQDTSTSASQHLPEGALPVGSGTALLPHQAAAGDGEPPEQATVAAPSACAVCGGRAQDRWILCGCGARTHLHCLAEHFMQVG
jgi:hypothetical protein